jgi:CheY-like chemotaxis protein
VEESCRFIGDAVGGAPRVLVAEDNVLWRTFVVSLLRQRGYSVAEVEDGQQAYAALANDRFDLVLLDINMPGLSGFEVTQAIRTRGTRVPIIAVTAHVDAGDRERCLGAGMNGHVPKPIRAEILFAEIERVLPRLRAAATEEHVGHLRRAGRLLRALDSLFTDAAPGMLAAIRSAAALRDPRALRAAVHDLRGAAGILRVQDLGPTLARLHGLARAAEYEAVESACVELEARLVSPRAAG